MSAEGRFWAKVNKTETCWLWTGSRKDSGYGKFYVSRRVFAAHRFAYEQTVGPIPEGLEIDHLCKVRHCVNPQHLEPVTPTTNRGRRRFPNSEKMVCAKGHPYSAENTRHRPCGRRACRTCERIGVAAYKKRLRERAGRPIPTGQNQAQPERTQP